jgi:sugar phosphate isomerase/epimerase
MIEHIIRNIQVCIPFQRLMKEYLPLFIEKRMNPEIGIDGETMDTVSKRDFQHIAAVLGDEGLTTTLHGPFYDLAPGAIDKKMLAATRKRLEQAFDLIPIFQPRSIVCHTGYDKKRYRDTETQWLENAFQTWSSLLAGIRETATQLVIENVYEKTPRILLKLLNALQGENVAFCFDTGHMNAFSTTSMRDWLHVTRPWIRQIHIHDNSGGWDDHLAIGKGSVDFEYLFADLAQTGRKPIITLEAHEEASVWESLEALNKSPSFCRLVSMKSIDEMPRDK